MKRKLLSILTMLLLAVMLVIPVEAADYGVVYDETEMLHSEEIEILGTETLPQFTETYGLDVRVDVLLGIGNYETLEAAAAGLYEAYDYGVGDGRNGVSLTVLLYEFEDSYALDNWYLYCAGDNADMLKNGLQDNVPIEAYLTEEAWAGDLEWDAQALAKTVEALAVELEELVISTEAADSTKTQDEEVITSLEPETAVEETQTAVSAEENDWMNGEAQLDRVTDTVGVLTDEQWQTLEKQARALEAQYNFGVYAVVVNDYRDYSDGSVQDAAEAIFKRYSLGTGPEKDGVLLLLSMGDRDYNLLTHGTNGNYTFNDEGRRYLTEYFLDDFAENDWYAGLEDYISWSGRYLEAAAQNEPYSSSNVPMTASERMMAIGIRVLIILLVPLAIAAIYIGVLTGKMKSVAEETKAAAYVSGNLNLTRKNDQFIRRTETRTKISDDSDSDSGSRSRSGSSSGFSGTSGKF